MLGTGGDGRRPAQAPRRVVVAGAVALATVGVLLASDLGRPARANEHRSPIAVTTTVAATTIAPAGAATTVAPTAAATTVSAATTVPLPEPESELTDPVRILVPSITAVAEALTDEADQQQAIAGALTEATNAVAVEDQPGTLCAVVPVTAPLIAEGRWERNGEPIGTSVTQRRDPPGYGDCITNDNGEAFRDGVYQYVALGPTGATSAAATVVVGSEPVDIWLVNNGDEPVCLVLMSPEQADFYEAHDTDTPLLPGEAIVIPAASVDHDVRVLGCPPDEHIASLAITPEPTTYVEMFEEENGDSPSTASTTTSAVSTTTTTTIQN
jgi:hypothetical protein